MNEPGRVKFIFPDDDGIAGWYAEAYMLDRGDDGEELVMPVKRFIGAIRRLKGAMAVAKADLGIHCMVRTEAKK